MESLGGSGISTSLSAVVEAAVVMEAGVVEKKDMAEEALAGLEDER